MSQQQPVANNNPATTKELALRGLSLASLMQALQTPWPQLERLELDLRGDYKAAVSTIADEVRRFLSNQKLPNLKHLVLCGSCFDDTVLKTVLEGPLVEQLQSIDFVVEKMTPEIRQTLSSARARCANLRLFPSADELSDPRMLLVRAQLARDLDSLPRAIELLDRAVEQGGNHTHLYEKAHLLLRQDNLQQALDTIEQALLRDPYFFPCLCLKIDILRRLGKVDEALTVAKQTRRRVHKEEHRLQTVAISMDILRQSGRESEMENEAMWGLADVDDEEEPSAQVYYWMAVIHAMLNNVDAAVGKLKDAIAKEPKLRKRAGQEALLQPLYADPRFAEILGKSAQNHNPAASPAE